MLGQSSCFLHRYFDALFGRIHGFRLVGRRVVAASRAIDRGTITAKSIGQEPGHTADRRDTDAGEGIDSAVGQALLKQLNHLPAIHQGL